jgi:hypothetical protein
MVTITWPTAQEVEVIDAIRGAIGRDVTFVTHVVSGCSASGCSLDPVTNTSTNSYCLSCSGTYWISTYSGTLISGHITWGQADIVNWYSSGQQFDGDCRIQIKYTVSNLSLIDNCDWLQVDDHCLSIKKRTLRGVQTLNRILLDCIELENHARYVPASEDSPAYLLTEDGMELLL